MAEAHRPDIIYLDLKMPEMSGSTVLRNLKADPATRDIPVIVISSEKPRPDEQAEIERTAQYFIQKNDLTADVLEKALQGVRGLRYARINGEEDSQAPERHDR